jgi:hypothetical protein
MQSTNWFRASGGFDDKRDSRRTQLQNPSLRRPPPAVKRESALIYQPAVKIFEGCSNKLGQNDSSAVQCLEDFCQRMNLEQPQYKTIPIGFEDGKQVFNCKVQVCSVK